MAPPLQPQPRHRQPEPGKQPVLTWQVTLPWRLAVLVVGLDTVTHARCSEPGTQEGQHSTFPRAHTSAAHQFHNSRVCEGWGPGFRPGDAGNKRHA